MLVLHHVHGEPFALLDSAGFNISYLRSNRRPRVPECQAPPACLPAASFFSAPWKRRAAGPPERSAASFVALWIFCSGTKPATQQKERVIANHLMWSLLKNQSSCCRHSSVSGRAYSASHCSNSQTSITPCGHRYKSQSVASCTEQNRQDGKQMNPDQFRDFV